MNLDTHTAAQPSQHHGRGPAYIEGAIDAVTETREVMTNRIAASYDHANITSSAAAQQWTDDYAAGALTTWLALDAMDTHLLTLGAL